MASSFEDDPRWLLVQRIVASAGFVNAHRLSTFLLYVTRQSLTGDGTSLNERSIGEAVFERSPDYDPRDDNIVRSHASRLRIRLEEYFAAEGANERIQVTIPRGSYLPVFETVDTTAHVPTSQAVHAGINAASLPTTDVQAISGSRLRLSGPVGAVLVLLVAAVLAGSGYLYHRSHPRPTETPSHKLWSQMFRSDQQTLIVSADSSLVIARLMTGRQVPLADYAGGGYHKTIDCDRPCDLAMVHTVEELRYTSMSDLEFAVKVTHLPEAIPDRTEIRYARDLELKDFKESNVILAGSQESDPWVSSISGQMNFVLHDDPRAGPLRVENRQPNEGERSDYPYDPNDPQHRGLATIAFLPNLGGTGNLLVVQGFSLAGTQAAAEFVTNERDLDALFPAYAGNATKLPHFEILLGTVEINGMASRPVPVTWHVYP